MALGGDEFLRSSDWAYRTSDQTPVEVSAPHRDLICAEAWVELTGDYSPTDVI